MGPSKYAPMDKIDVHLCWLVEIATDVIRREANLAPE